MLKLSEILTHLSFPSPGNIWVFLKIVHISKDPLVQEPFGSPCCPFADLWWMSSSALSVSRLRALSMLLLLPHGCSVVLPSLFWAFSRPCGYLPCYLHPILALTVCSPSEVHLYIESGQLETVHFSALLWGPLDFFQSTSWHSTAQLKSAYPVRVHTAECLDPLRHVPWTLHGKCA